MNLLDMIREMPLFMKQFICLILLLNIIKFFIWPGLFKGHSTKDNRRGDKQYSQTEEERKAAIIEAGKQGEAETQFHLSYLPTNEYCILNNVRIYDNNTNRKAEIDHVVIGNAGVFVIETKNYSGTIHASSAGWYREKNNGEREALSDPAGQNERHKSLLRELLSYRGYKDIPFYSIVAIANKDAIIMGQSEYAEVMKAENVSACISHKPYVLKDDMVRKIYEEISRLNVSVKI